MYYQQGDVLIFKEETLPKDLKKLKTNVVHKGDNHVHLIDGKFELLSGKDSFYIHAKEKCKLTHAEHNTISLPKGFYRKGIVQEYDHFLQESKNVID